MSKVDTTAGETPIDPDEAKGLLLGINTQEAGNGRHARFCADRLVENLGGRAFPWGRSDLRGEGEARQSYLAALKVADTGDLEPLVQFARSGAEREK